MTPQEIARTLVNYCRQGEYEKAQRELYSDDILSIEPQASPGFDKEERGLDNIIARGHRFMSSVEKFHASEVSEPLGAGNVIAFTLVMDLTMKEQGSSTMSELCVYTVKDGKIISEQFFM